MEIIDYLRTARRRWWILVLVPVLAAGGAVAVILLQPPMYTAMATVSGDTFVGDPGSPFAGTQGVQQFIGAFTAAAENPRTRAAVQAATGVAPTEQAVAVTFTPIGSSADMQISVTLPKHEQVGPVASETVAQALHLMFDTRATEAAASRDLAQQAATAANTALAQLSSKYQIADPPVAYQAKLSQVTNLQQLQANLRATGNTAGAAAMDAPIAAANADLTAFLPMLSAYDDAKAKLTAADNDLSQAQVQYRLASSLATASAGGGLVYLGQTVQTDRTSTLVTMVPVTVGAGLFLAVVLVLLIEMVVRVRGAQRANAAVQSAMADLNADIERQSVRATGTDAALAGAPVQA